MVIATITPRLLPVFFRERRVEKGSLEGKWIKLLTRGGEILECLEFERDARAFVQLEWDERTCSVRFRENPFVDLFWIRQSLNRGRRKKKKRNTHETNEEIDLPYRL